MKASVRFESHGVRIALSSDSATTLDAAELVEALFSSPFWSAAAESP